MYYKSFLVKVTVLGGFCVRRTSFGEDFQASACNAKLTAVSMESRLKRT